MTQAEQIAARFGNDGQVWQDIGGYCLDDVCEKCGGVRYWRDGYGYDTYKYVFHDESVIMVAGAAWDLGFKNCWCWGSLGHDCEKFHPTHEITVTNYDGTREKILVQLDSDGAAYTQEEWDAEVNADWTYDKEHGWLFHGCAGPTGNCTVEVKTIKQ